MKVVMAVSGVVLLLSWGMPLCAPCEEADEEKAVSGKVGVAMKYDTNEALVSGNAPDDGGEFEPIVDAFITQVSATFRYASDWESRWRAEAQLYGLADLHIPGIDDSWCLGRGNTTVGYDFGASTLSLLNEARYFSEPDDMEFDNLRNTTSLVYKRFFSDLWQMRLGYENTPHIFPQNRFFSFYGDGGFVEVRADWRPTFSTYYRYGFRYHRAHSAAGTGDSPGAWRAGEDSALPGIMMPGVPQVGQVFSQEYWECNAEDLAEITAFGEAIEVPAGTFDDTLSATDYDPLGDCGGEDKVYVSGIGLAIDEDAVLISY